MSEPIDFWIMIFLFALGVAMSIGYLIGYWTGKKEQMRGKDK